jgi:hypothetical protein
LILKDFLFYSIVCIAMPFKCAEKERKEGNKAKQQGAKGEGSEGM